MKVLIFSVLVLSLSAFAADKKTVAATSATAKKTESSGTLDVAPTSKSSEIADETATVSDKNVMKAHVTCKARDGHELKQGEAGYDACIQKVKTDKHNKNDPKAEVEVKLEK